MENDLNAGSGELTSSMGSISTKPTQDSNLTSSSDAKQIDNSSTSHENPISSTSDKDPPRVSTPFRNTHGCSLGMETDQFANEYNLTSISSEKITENVEDIVSDLENLLGDTSAISHTRKSQEEDGRVDFVPVASSTQKHDEIDSKIKDIEVESSMQSTAQAGDASSTKKSNLSRVDSLGSATEESMDLTPTPETSTITERSLAAPEQSIMSEDTSRGLESNCEMESMEIEEDADGKIESSTFQMEESRSGSRGTPEEAVDDDAVLVRAAFEASAMSNVSSRLEDRSDEEQQASISDEDVIRAAMDCTARNEEDDLIRAAQDSHEAKMAGTDQKSAFRALSERLSTEERSRMEELQQNVGLEYRKPLNIVVDPPAEVSIVKEAESTTNEEVNKESSDDNDDKSGEEYSSKISKNQELKITIRKNKAEESSILKIYDPKAPVPEVSPSESETEPEPESPLPKIIIKQSQISPKVMSPIKITFKQMKPEEQVQPKASPKLIIKPIVKPEEEMHHSPKITIKPIPKPDEHERSHSPKVTIKAIMKPSTVEACVSPKIKIKPIVKPDDEGLHEEERIVLKISKNRDVLQKADESEKLAKIKVKFSMGRGHAHIVSEDAAGKLMEESELEDKRQKLEPSLNDVSATAPTEKAVELIVEPKVEVIPPAPKKRGRPRKVPLQVRVEDEEPVVVEQPENPEPMPQETRSGRPKRSCRGVSVRDTLGIKPRKPRGRGRGRGRGARAQTKKSKAAESKLKLIKEAALTTQINEAFHYHDIEMKSEDDEASKEQAEVRLMQEAKPVVDMFEEDTRMSADIQSGNRTPAKQMINNDTFVDESQSSVQSTATTESVKIKKPKVEIEPEGSVISADQLAEYYWGGGGPYMIQEQVAQFLGIKSFKRKYPGIPRRPVDMQERDFIRESGLASEHMCDLGLTAVNSADILDLMYSDFHFKYEEYCKHQRDRQTKDITNKQKALSLAASQEKNKIDIMQQAIESAAHWNANFNRTRREERKACMDLQNFTINYPRGRMKQINRPKVGHYPLALVPGQYTDYYKSFTPTDLNNLPLNTMLYHEINIPHEEDSQSDGSGSDSETTSSGSDSSESDSSDDDCNMCTPPHFGHSGSKRILT